MDFTQKERRKMNHPVLVVALCAVAGGISGWLIGELVRYIRIRRWERRVYGGR